MRTTACCWLLPLLANVVCAQQLQLHPLLSDHAVVQADRPIHVYGTAVPGMPVAVEFGAHKSQTTADAQGAWHTQLPATAATATPNDLIARSNGNEARARDILVGEVWVCSGQSNMVWRIRSSSTPDAFAATADVPTIRMFTAPTQDSPKPQESLRGSWEVCSTENVRNFSAVGYHFGRALSDSLEVPIGLVNISWGGSSIEAWMRRDLLTELPMAAPALLEYEQYRKAAGTPMATWAAVSLDDSQWQNASLPGMFKDLGHDLDGIIEFRRRVDIPESWAGRDLTLSLGPIDDRDVTCFQGQKIGSQNNHRVDRSYTVPGKLVKPGTAVIAVRVTDNSGPGGFAGPSEKMSLRPKDEETDGLSLAGSWQLRVASKVKIAPRQHRPAHLFNAMTYPLRQLAPRGVIWYQGENNAKQPKGPEYAELFPAMIRDWRQLFGDPEMPFLFVQLPNFGGNEASSIWRYPLVRQAQVEALQNLDNTGMAITLDIGNPRDIHPQNKHDVGRRLARWALSDVYGKTGIVKSGPVATAAQFADDGSITIEFDLFSGKLTTRDGAAPGNLEVAGADGKFLPATAKILDGEQLVVSCPQVPQPTVVRYAWQNSPEHANLIGGDDLPASPFRFVRD